MSDIVYLKMTGEQQGDISSGCGTIDSVGNRHQPGHEDEIFAFSLANGMSATVGGVKFQTLNFTKLIDKSSPQLANGITKNEKYFLEFNIYRINKSGRWERYFYIELRGATLSRVEVSCAHNNLDTETISVCYEYIRCIHHIANTEFSYLAFPENYNDLCSNKNPIIAARKSIATAQDTTTINSKAAGRLLAAGGIYNGNIEGFRQTAEQLGGDAPAGYDQVMDNKGLIIAGVSAAAGLGLGRLGAASELSEMENFHVLGKVEGEYSMINPGPLSNRFAETFSGGVYKEITLSENTAFYRGGQSGTNLGRFFSYEQPQGIIQTRIDQAVLPVWPDGSKSIIDSYFKVEIPAGSKVYVGNIGYQTDLYPGGSDQVFIPAPWDIPGVKTLDFGELK